MRVAKNDIERLPPHGVVRLLLELHKEALEGQDPVLWGRLYGEVRGEPRPGYVFDGCSSDGDGAVLICNISCDGGNFAVAAGAQGGVRLTVGETGVVLKSCGSAVAEIGAFNVAPADLPTGAFLKPLDDSACRQTMAPFEKLLQDEENGTD